MRRIAPVGVASAALLTGVASGASLLSGESWVGSQYGWTADPPRSCRPVADVCSTEDGGATWHGIFRGGTFVFGVVRTSRTAGVVSTGRQISERFWTRDNGRHWYRTRMVGPEFQGSGPYLFWIDFRSALHQVKPWPPRGKARCRGPWVGAAFETRAVKNENVCGGPAVEAGMRTTVAVRLEEGTLAGLANVPGGVIATVTSSPVPRMLLFRRGVPRVVDLPRSGMVPCVGFGREPVVSWPRITVLGCGTAEGDLAGAWVSADGGVAWRALPANQKANLTRSPPRLFHVHFG